MITHQRSSWLLNEFSLLAPHEMYRENYREYAYWCWVFQIRTVHMGLRWLVERWQMMGNWELLSLRYEREVQLRDKPSFKLVMTWVIVLCGRLEEKNSDRCKKWKNVMKISHVDHELTDQPIDLLTETDKLMDKQTILFRFCLCLSTCRSVSLNVYLPLSVISVCLLSCLFPLPICLAVCLFIFFRQSVCLVVCETVNLPVCLAVCLFACLSVFMLSVRLSVCLSGWFSIINWVRNVNWPP